jgi:23S rRNA (guanosine2251-2'-O)-methyltransferase
MRLTFGLENIRSAWNIGSVFRTSDALGADVILTGYTPRPRDATLPMIKKTAIGAEEWIAWEEFTRAEEAVEHYPNSLHLAIEITDESLNIYDFLKTEGVFEGYDHVVLWFGNEIHGVSDGLVRACKHAIHLPMKGKKESLNVASSLAASGYLFLEHVR